MLELEAVHHQFDGTVVLDGVDLSVDDGEILCLLGASGSGKSTLLRVVAGLEPLQQGRVLFAGDALATPGDEPPAEQRCFGLVFQDHVLFPHLSVADNIGFGLNELPSTERDVRVQQQLQAVGLASFAKRYPHTLSGGQQQRVALARALAPQPRLMLLDEPFASVDSTLRRQLREETRRALRTAGIPAIVVTHDAEEAMELADRIAVIDAGKIVQLGTPGEVWRHPVNRFVAELFGGTDAIVGRAQAGEIVTAFGPISPTVPVPLDETVYDVIVRRHSVTLTERPDAGILVEDIRFLGGRYLVVLQAQGERLRVDLADAPNLAIGTHVQASFDSAGLLVYVRPSG